MNCLLILNESDHFSCGTIYSCVTVDCISETKRSITDMGPSKSTWKQGKQAAGVAENGQIPAAVNNINCVTKLCNCDRAVLGSAVPLTVSDKEPLIRAHRQRSLLSGRLLCQTGQNYADKINSA